MSYSLLGNESATLEDGTDEAVTIWGYKSCKWKTFFYHVCSILLLGIPYWIGYWKPEWKIYCTFGRCPLYQADIVLLQVGYYIGYDLITDFTQYCFKF